MGVQVDQKYLEMCVEAEILQVEVGGLKIEVQADEVV